MVARGQQLYICVAVIGTAGNPGKLISWLPFVLFSIIFTHICKGGRWSAELVKVSQLTEIEIQRQKSMANTLVL